MTHAVLISPGLGDHRQFELWAIDWLTRDWQKYGLTPIIHKIDWRKGDKFQPKLEKRVRSIINFFIA